ncbi:MAG: hypothetical protein LBQ28_06850 [Prevotellaceae bacterium]|jgi:hypothetical protein|nr:hypothetical protein [Prevotellaceae bacterium]
MKRNIFIIITTLVFANCLAQTDRKIFVADSITKTPIEYASIVFVDVEGGTYSNDKGVFYTPNNIQKIEISSIGYNTKSIILQKNIDTIFLSPQVYEISEVKILPSSKKKRKLVELGYASEKSTHVIGTFISGREIAVYIPLDTESNTFRLIKQVIIIGGIEYQSIKIGGKKYIVRKQKDYTNIFKIKFYQVTENKEIGDIINTEDIVLSCNVLKSKTVLDVSKYNVYMPENGIFVAMEFVGKINNETGEIITDSKKNIFPSVVRVSWEIENSISYEKLKFKKNYGDNWQKVDKNYEEVKMIKTSNKNLKEDAFYTPLFSIVLE